MKNLKRIIMVLFASILLVAIVFPAAASSENTTKNDIISEINNGVQVSGSVKHIPGEYVKLASDILYTESLSESELNYIMDEILIGKSIWVESGKLNFEQMSNDYKNRLTSLVTEVSNRLGMKVTLQGKEIKIVTNSGRTYSTHAFLDLSIDSSSVIKDTGMDINIGPLIFALGLFVVCAFIGLIVYFKTHRKEC